MSIMNRNPTQNYCDQSMVDFRHRYFKFRKLLAMLWISFMKNFPFQVNVDKSMADSLRKGETEKKNVQEIKHYVILEANKAFRRRVQALAALLTVLFLLVWAEVTYILNF